MRCEIKQIVKTFKVTKETLDAAMFLLRGNSLSTKQISKTLDILKINSVSEANLGLAGISGTFNHKEGDVVLVRKQHWILMLFWLPKKQIKAKSSGWI